MRTAEFDYYLPPQQIAQTPAEPRDSASLMVLDRESGRLEHRIFREIGAYLRSGDLLVLNDTRVIPARLYARKAATGGRVEILLLEEQESQTWLALVGGRKTRAGTVLELVDENGELGGVRAEVKGVGSRGQRVIAFDQPTDQWLWVLGKMPLPPYIHHYAGDPQRYQTVFARHNGSAAATTAGLHFTPALLLSLRQMGVGLVFVTLRIGLDTFRPIDEEEIAEHPIHTEWAQLDPDSARQINEAGLAGGRVVAVGTTVVRVLETAALRVIPAQGGADRRGWTPVAAFEGPTDLYITPGFRFRAVQAMITNFHLPRSTLMVLVAAFTGLDALKRAYSTAVEHHYRFYSFGDAMLIL